MKTFFKKPIFYVPLAIVLIIIIAMIGLSNKEEKIEYNTAIIEKSDLTQEVSVTGKVQAADSVELAFEKPGKISSIKVNVGDSVKKGQLLATLTSSDIYAQLGQAQASLESSRALLSNYEAALSAQQTKLDELKKGTRPEEMSIAQTSVMNAENNLENSKTNLENVKTKAIADLQNQLEVSAASLSNSVNTGLSVLFTITDIQGTYFGEYDQNGYKVSDAKSQAVYSLLGGLNGGRTSNNTLSNLSGGAKGLVINAESTPTEANLSLAITATKSALMNIRSTLNAIPISNLTTTEITSINTQRGYIDAEISAVATKENAISVQKATNQSSISTAESSITTSQNALQTAKDNLSLKQAGSTPDQISAQQSQVDLAEANVNSQKAQIKYARANVNNYAAQLSKNSIRSPLEGTVVMQEAKVGEISQANVPIIKVMTDNNFEIEANIAEVDIANIKLEDQAKVTLDAYGSDKIFTAVVVEIDPAETVIDGVPTYKITFQFAEENGLIKSGMTANLDIVTAERENILSVPQRAVLRSNGKKLIRILQTDNTIQEVTVVTGIRGTDGNIEVIEGLSEGDNVILSTKE
jgi:RND family efflux transporter MFP subunit